MYIEGIITAVDNYKVKIKIAEMDDFETNWLVVPQKFTVNKKSGYMPEIGALVGAILSDDMSYGAILGELYNDEDNFLEEKINDDFVIYEDGAGFNHSKNSNQIDITAETFKINADTKCTGDVFDKKGSMQAIRDWLNNHTHSNGNNGADTGIPKNLI